MPFWVENEVIGMNFQTALKTCLSNCVSFQGRAARSEFWWLALFVWCGQLILSVVDGTALGTVTTYDGGFEAQTSTPILSGVFGLVMLLPIISVAVRRLHDKDRTGWWCWVALVPLVGALVLLFWCLTEGTRGDNRFGPDPLEKASGRAGGPQDNDLSSILYPACRQLTCGAQQFWEAIFRPAHSNLLSICPFLRSM